MIKMETAIAQTHMLEESRRSPGGKTAQGSGVTAGSDAVEVSEECKKRLVMSNLKATLSSPGGHKSRYNR